MDTFLKQYNRLSPKKQRMFVHTWGERPWEDLKMNSPQQRMAWKRDLYPLPEWPRWKPEAVHADSPLWMALRAKNRRAARALLDKTPSLTRKEAGQCALLTLQWAPDLLERILDLTPDRAYYWLQHEVTLDRKKNRKLRLRGSLVMMAAALDDLPALEILLGRGAPADYDFRRDRWEIVEDLLVDGVTMGALHSPDYSLQEMEWNYPFPDDSSHVLLHADPLSAAIFCNAKRCAARLLEEPEVTVTDAVRRALAITPENETQKLVARRLDLQLEELLQPEDFGPELDHSLFLPVLRRHGQISRQKLEALVEHYECAGDPALQARRLEIFSLIDPALLGDVVWQMWQNNLQKREILELARTFALPLDRCRVSEHCRREYLIALMENFLITGDPPEGGLSGLAAALLRLLEDQGYLRAITVEQLLHMPGVPSVLQTEDPRMVTAWLDSHPNIPATQTLPLKSLLNIRKEVSYVL